MRKFALAAAALTLAAPAFAFNPQSAEDAGMKPVQTAAEAEEVREAKLAALESPSHEKVAMAGAPAEQLAALDKPPATGALSKARPDALAAVAGFDGVGGPVEERSFYPPCDPGPGDDNCIQLYERGVTGAGS